MTTKDNEILRLRIALQRSYRLLVDAGNVLTKVDSPIAVVERLHEHADKLRDVVGDVDAPMPMAEVELRALLNEARRGLERGERFVRTGSGIGLLDRIDAAVGSDDGAKDLPF